MLRAIKHIFLRGQEVSLLGVKKVQLSLCDLKPVQNVKKILPETSTGLSPGQAGEQPDGNQASLLISLT